MDNHEMQCVTYLRHLPYDDTAGGTAADDAAHVGTEPAARDRARVAQPRVRVHALLVQPHLPPYPQSSTSIIYNVNSPNASVKVYLHKLLFELKTFLYTLTIWSLAPVTNSWPFAEMCRPLMAPTLLASSYTIEVLLTFNNWKAVKYEQLLPICYKTF